MKYYDINRLFDHKDYKYYVAKKLHYVYMILYEIL